MSPVYRWTFCRKSKGPFRQPVKRYGCGGASRCGALSGLVLAGSILGTNNARCGNLPNQEVRSYPAIFAAVLQKIGK